MSKSLQLWLTKREIELIISFMQTSDYYNDSAREIEKRLTAALNKAKQS